MGAQPLAWTEGQTKDFWHDELRPETFIVLEVLGTCFAKTLAGVRSLLIRADKGFHDHKAVKWLEKRNI